MYNATYLTDDLAKQTKYKSVYDAWNRDDFSLVVYDKAWWTERSVLSNRTFNLVKKEMRRLYPDLTYIGDIRERSL